MLEYAEIAEAMKITHLLLSSHVILVRMCNLLGHFTKNHIIC